MSWSCELLFVANVDVTDYAAAFFLLGDSLEDAVNVCVDRLKDLQLAIAIVRVYEGDEGPVLRRLLEEEILPYAAQEGNRWLASWAFWMLNRKDMAVRALIVRFASLFFSPPVASTMPLPRQSGWRERGRLLRLRSPTTRARWKACRDRH